MTNRVQTYGQALKNEKLIPYFVNDLTHGTWYGKRQGQGFLSDPYFKERALPYLADVLANGSLEEKMEIEKRLLLFGTQDTQTVLDLMKSPMPSSTSSLDSSSPLISPSEPAISDSIISEVEVKELLSAVGQDRNNTGAINDLAKKGLAGASYIFDIAFDDKAPGFEDAAAQWLGTLSLVSGPGFSKEIAPYAKHPIGIHQNIDIVLLYRKKTPEDEARRLLKAFMTGKAYRSGLGNQGLYTLAKIYPDLMMTWMEGNDPELRSAAVFAKAHWIPTQEPVLRNAIKGLSSSSDLERTMALVTLRQLQPRDYYYLIPHIDLIKSFLTDNTTTLTSWPRANSNLAADILQKINDPAAKSAYESFINQSQPFIPKP